jgi:hypothetical protein
MEAGDVMIPCTHAGPCKQLAAAGKRGPAFEPWRRTAVWFKHAKFINMGIDVTKVRFAKVRP